MGRSVGWWNENESTVEGMHDVDSRYVCKRQLGKKIIRKKNSRKKKTVTLKQKKRVKENAGEGYQGVQC